MAEEKKKKILIVDDEEAIRMLLKEVLEMQGYEVITVASGEEAVAKAKEENFEVVITDLKMPGISGVEVIKEVKQANADSCVIVVTGYASIETAIESMREGAYDYITKPFNIDSIRIVVNRALERQKLYKEAQEKEFFKKLSILDGLTGIYNHRYFYDSLKNEIAGAQRYKYALSLLMIDIDDFKKYNDTYGHPTGDEVLRKISGALISGTRKSDICARYGGEEFAVILPHTTKQGAYEMAKRIRRQVDDMKFYPVKDSEPVNLTVSIGLASFAEDAKTIDALINTADKALYEAKNLGKNRVCLFKREK